MFGKIKQFIAKVTKLDIVRVFSFTSLSTLVKMLTGFISVKVVAVIIGPAGVALVGQLNNFASIIMTLANGGITSGVTRNIAAFKDNDEVIKGYIGTSVKITLVLSALCEVFLILFSRYLCNIILHNDEYAYVFIIFGVTLFFYALNTLIMAVINGYKYFQLYVKISMISSVVGLGISLLLVSALGVSGALINAVTSQTFIFIVTMIFLWKNKMPFVSLKWLLARFDYSKMLNLLKFSLMTLVTAFCGPVVQLVIRNHIINTMSIETAGCWEGMNRLSGMYLMVITSSFGVYYMPRLAELKDSKDLKHEILTAYKVIVPCLVVGFTLVYLMRNFIINILFSPDFYQMKDLFLWQLLGDFFKITSWLLAYVMSAKAMMKTFIATEILFNGSYIVFALLCSYFLGVSGVIIGYMINYICYLFTMYFLIWRKI